MRNKTIDGGGNARASARAWRAAGIAVLAVALGGCLSVPIPQAAADPARFYVLNAVTPAMAASASGGAAGAASAVQLQPVDVANYLRARPMVVRRGENEIQFREFARWGEPLELGVARVLREELLARGAARSVVTGASHVANGPAQLALSVRVLACEGGADGGVLFRAAWEVAPVGSGANGSAGEGSGMRRGDFRAENLRWDGKSEASLAAQLSVAVSQLAGEIAGTLKP